MYSHGMARPNVVYNSIRRPKTGQSPSATRANDSLIPKVGRFVRIAYELRTSLHKNGAVTERPEDFEWSCLLLCGIHQAWGRRDKESLLYM